MGLRDQRFVILDTETTGADAAAGDVPIEVAVIEWRNGKPGAHESWLVDPQRFIHPAASAVHGLSDADVEGKPIMAEVLPAILEFIGDSPLVAHNSPFDRGMMPALETHQWIDSLRLARHTWSLGERNEKGFELTSHKQQEIRFWLGLTVDTMGLAAHRALGDVLVTGDLFQLTIDKYLADGHKDDLAEFIAYAEAPVQWPRMPWGMHKGKEFADLPSKFLTGQITLYGEGKLDEDLGQILIKEQARRISAERIQQTSIFARKPGA